MDCGIFLMGQAAGEGNTDRVYELLQQDPSILRRIDDDSPFVQTPLHIAVQHMVQEQNDEQIRAANKRYLEFALEMMNLKPSFARKLNPSGLSPMHLAVEKGQTLVVRELLKVDKDLARVKGKGGQTPLHFAAYHQADLLVKFLEACPECITDVNIHGQTAFQVAVKNGSYEAAKRLASWICRSTHKDSKTWERVVLNGEDHEGNTVLHIAALNNDPEMVKLLLKFNISKNKINLDNKTALDISGGQNSSTETGVVLRQAKCLVAREIPGGPTLAQPLRFTELSFMEVLLRDVKRQRNKISNKSLNALLVVYTLIVTTTYQACLSPPGGFTQENNIPGNFTQGNITNFHNISLKDQQKPVGVSVLDSSDFNYFYFANTLTFGFTVSTMIALLLLTDTAKGMLSYPPLALLIFCYSFNVSTISPTENRGYVILPFLSVTFPLSLYLVGQLYSFKFAA